MKEDGLPDCPHCGTAIPKDAPGGLCPACVMVMTLAPDTEMLEENGSTVRASHPVPSLDEVAGEFPQLEILGCLGRGGMGVVYKARQKRLNRLVALKLLAPERTTDPRFAQRFEREAQALAALSHPSIVAVYDFGQAGGFYYLLMEFVDGLNLREAMQTARFTPEQALRIVPQVCEALHYAHECGVVHRDIKPENLLLDTVGRVKLADFGIAKMLEPSRENAPFTEFPNAGTPGYMAPEQADRGLADRRSDIYSLGVVCYELLTGELPVRPVVPPSQKVQVDVRLDQVVLRALQSNPERRYQEAREFQTRLETVARQLPKRTGRGAVFAISALVLTCGSLALCGLLCGSDGGGGTDAPWAETERHFRESYQLQYAPAYQAKLKTLDDQYIMALERELQGATQGNRLEEAIAIRNEIERIQKQTPLPGGEDQVRVVTLRKMRDAYGKQYSSILQERDSAAAPLVSNYAKALEGLHAELTTSGKLDLALQVKQYRDGNVGSKLIPGYAQAPVSRSNLPAGNLRPEPLRTPRPGVWALDLSLPARLRLPVGAGAAPVERVRPPVEGFPDEGFTGEISIPSGYRDTEPHGLMIEAISLTQLPPIPPGEEDVCKGRKIISIRAATGVEFSQIGAEEAVIRCSRALRQWALQNYHIDATRCYLVAQQRSVLRQVGRYPDEFTGVIQFGYRYNAFQGGAQSGVQRHPGILPDSALEILKAGKFRMAYVAGGPNTKGLPSPEITQETKVLQEDGLNLLYLPTAGYSPVDRLKAVEFIDPQR